MQLNIITLHQFFVDATPTENFPIKVPSKVCKKCRVLKPLEEFGKNNSKKDKLDIYCKCCKNAESAIYRAGENKEEIAAYQATYNAEHKEEIAAKKAIYYAEHKEEIAARNAIHYVEHKEEIAIYNAEHKEEIAARNATWYLNEVRNGIPSDLQNSPLDVYWNVYTNDSLEPVYKIGVSIGAEYRNKNNKPLNKDTEHQNLITVTYQDRKDGFTVEQWFKNTFKVHKYVGDDILSSGNTELFNTDLFALYGIILINDNIFFYVKDGIIETPLKKDIEAIENSLTFPKYLL